MTDDKYIEFKFGDVVLLITRSADPKTPIGQTIKRAQREIPAWLHVPTWDDALVKLETMSGRYEVPHVELNDPMLLK